jgi:Cd2+/Zn2+-exporting ATPase
MSLIADLTQIGFTEYEAKVYTTLLETSPATGYRISKQSGVPRSMVYETLRRLHGRGVVLENIEGRATLYRPLPPEVLLDQYVGDHQRLIAVLRTGLQERYSAQKMEGAWSISGHSAVLAYAEQLIREAEEEVSLVLNDQDLEMLRGEISAVSAAGVAVHALLTGEGKLEYGNVLHHPPLESELQGLLDTLLVVIDNTEALIASTSEETTATVTKNPNLVMIARQFVWMEMFTQRIYAQLGPDLLASLDPQDRQIFESLQTEKEKE